MEIRIELQKRRNCRAIHPFCEAQSCNKIWCFQFIFISYFFKCLLIHFDEYKNIGYVTNDDPYIC